MKIRTNEIIFKKSNKYIASNENFILHTGNIKWSEIAITVFYNEINFFGFISIFNSFTIAYYHSDIAHR